MKTLFLDIRNIINLKIIWIVSLALMLFLMFFYVFQIGTLTQGTYLIKDYGNRLKNLSEENKILEINLSKFESLKNIENYILSGNFVKTSAGQVKYIQLLGGAVVAK